ncbi:hypothetical protein [Rothia mucilaginosa]|uniref:hypothetical protein n=1 Tax=Rothia mucilaginosa TaxID=43675 RepID=UPI001319D40E|nr:hypothetical protein [Rothia mucilaginosa]DAF39198.1 MAG TPA: hypothetical protein [Caudoviricetes sp.]DAY14015.1 MAG TPA: hypothetical protein [Caudoviricetes sp.]
MKSPDNRHQYIAVVDVPKIGLVRVAAKLAKDPEYLGKIDVLSIFPIKPGKRGKAWKKKSSQSIF